jgi:hypothetical protein
MRYNSELRLCKFAGRVGEGLLLLWGKKGKCKAAGFVAGLVWGRWMNFGYFVRMAQTTLLYL